MSFDKYKAENAYRTDKKILNAVPSRSMTHNRAMDVTSNTSANVQHAERVSEASVTTKDSQDNNEFIAKRCKEFCNVNTIKNCYDKCYGDDSVRVTQTCEQARLSWINTEFFDTFNCDGRTPTLVLIGQGGGSLTATDTQEFETWNQNTSRKYALETGLCNKFDPKTPYGDNSTFEEFGKNKWGTGNNLYACDNQFCDLDEENRSFKNLCPRAGVKVNTDGVIIKRGSDLLAEKLTKELCENAIGGVWKNEKKCSVTKYKHAMNQVLVGKDGTTSKINGMVCPQNYERCRGVDIVCPRLLNNTNMLEELPDRQNVGKQENGPWFAKTNGYNENTANLELNRPFSSVEDALRVIQDTWGGSFVMRCWEK